MFRICSGVSFIAGTAFRFCFYGVINATFEDLNGSPRMAQFIPEFVKVGQRRRCYPEASGAYLVHNVVPPSPSSCRPSYLKAEAPVVYFCIMICQ